MSRGDIILRLVDVTRVYETKEGRKINRRIELILSPNLDDLYDILEE